MKMPCRLLVLAIALALPLASHAEDPPCLPYEDFIHLAAQLPGQGVYHLEPVGTYLVGVGSGGLQIIDAADRAHPAWVASLPISTGAYDLALCADRNHVIIAGPEGLARMDLGDPAVPAPLSNRQLGDIAYPCPVAVVDHTAIVFREGAGLTLFSIADPDTFIFRSSLAMPNVAMVRDMVAQGDHLYLAVADNLIVVDISNPWAPAVVYTLPDIGYVQALDLAGDRLAGAVTSVGVQLFDLTDPARPSLAGAGDISFGGKEVRLLGDWALVAGSYSNRYGFVLYDLSHPSGIVARSLVNTEFNHTIAGTGNYIFVSGFEGLQVYRTNSGDLAQSLPPAEFPGPYGDITYGGGLVMEEDRIFIYSPAKVLAYGKTPGGILTLLSESPVPDYPQVRGMILNDDVVILPLVFKGLEIYDMTNPANPVHAPRHYTPGDSYQVAAAEGLVYLADGWEGIKVLDIHPPAPVALVGSADPYGCFQDLVWDQGLLYTAAGVKGLMIFDVTDPSDPTLIGSIDDCEEADRIAYEDGLVVLGDYRDGVHFYDVTDPENPQHLAFLARPHFVKDILLHDGFAYLANDDYGFQVIDVREPVNPRVVGLIQYGGAEYLWETPDGLYGGPRFCILPYACADMTPVFPVGRLTPPPSHLRAWPNPFNPLTRLSFELQSASRVSLKAYDLQGRLVRTLLDNEPMAEGRHETAWDGRGARGTPLASGTYLLRLEDGRRGVSRTVVLLK